MAAACLKSFRIQTFFKQSNYLSKHMFISVRYRIKEPDFYIFKKGVLRGPEHLLRSPVEDRTKVWKDQNSDRYTEVEEVEGHWHFVERLLPPEKLVPEEKYGDAVLPSGWKPPSANLETDSPYFIKRTKNNVLPVYYKLEPRGPREVTTLKNIRGEIWELEKDLRKFLETKYEKEMNIGVNEFVGLIRFKGNYLTDLQDWLYDRGF